MAEKWDEKIHGSNIPDEDIYTIIDTKPADDGKIEIMLEGEGGGRIKLLTDDDGNIFNRYVYDEGGEIISFEDMKNYPQAASGKIKEILAKIIDRKSGSESQSSTTIN